MQAHLEGDRVMVGAGARERYHDSRGYGRPRGDGLVLARVEAAHLLARGDLDAVDGQGFADFLAANPGVAVPFLVYADLRERGFYVSPALPDWIDEPGGADLIVHPRGDGPWDGTVEHRVRVIGERDDVPLRSLGDVVLAVVDEESEITYLETGRPAVEGSTEPVGDGSVEGQLLADRVVCWEPASGLYERDFYGQPLGGDEAALQLSLLEAAHLAEEGRLSIAGGAGAVRERGRAVEGERFDRRLAVYRALRDRGVVPKTGFKFGADFRTYADVDGVGDLGHSELLVRVLPADDDRSPRDLALDVRLAHGVRKRMVYALVRGEGDDDGSTGTDGGPGAHVEGQGGDADVEWVAVARLTP